jgi:MFS family permease
MAAEGTTAETAPEWATSDDPPLCPTLPWWALPFSALRHRNYRLYFGGQLVSLIGSWVQTTALMWLAYHLTRQSQWPALIATAQILPTFFLGAWGGALADRVSKRALIFTTQAALLVLAVLLGGLVLSGHVTPWQLLAISLAAGVVNAIDLPARLSFVMDMVGREDLVNAVALNSLLFNAARVMGPAVGGLMLTRLGPGHCFLINGLSFVAVLAALALMDVSGTARGPTRPGLRALLDGWSHVIRRPALACLMIMTGLISLFGWPFVTLLPALADSTSGGQGIGTDPGIAEQGASYSQLLVGTGGGALLAAFTLAALSGARWRLPFLIAAVAAAVAGLCGLSLVRDLEPAAAGCAVAGFGLVLFNATSQSMVQLSTTDENRGRVMGIWSIIICGAMPLGNLVVGRGADTWGVAPVLAGEGIACLASAGTVLALLALWTRRRGASTLESPSTEHHATGQLEDAQPGQTPQHQEEHPHSASRGSPAAVNNANGCHLKSEPNKQDRH